jgi:hypothetical protein
MVHQGNLHNDCYGSANSNREPKKLVIHVSDLGIQLIKVQERLRLVYCRGNGIRASRVRQRLIEEGRVHRGRIGVVCRYKGRPG